VSRVNQILILDNGSLIAKGNYNQLLASGFDMNNLNFLQAKLEHASENIQENYIIYKPADSLHTESSSALELNMSILLNVKKKNINFHF
jgi:phage pi2 protein 07